MRVSFATPRHAGVPRLVAALLILVPGALGFIQVVFLLLARWWTWIDAPPTDLGAADPLLTREVKFLFLWGAVLLVAGAFGWLLLPSLRRDQLAVDPDGVTLDVNGTVYEVPWESVETLRLQHLPLPRRTLAMDRTGAFHLVVTAEDTEAAIALPLHTFAADVNEIMEAVRVHAPEDLDLDVIEEPAVSLD